MAAATASPAQRPGSLPPRPPRDLASAEMAGAGVVPRPAEAVDRGGGGGVVVVASVAAVTTDALCTTCGSMMMPGSGGGIGDTEGSGEGFDRLRVHPSRIAAAGGNKNSSGRRQAGGRQAHGRGEAQRGRDAAHLPPSPLNLVFLAPTYSHAPSLQQDIRLYRQQSQSLHATAHNRTLTHHIPHGMRLMRKLQSRRGGRPARVSPARRAGRHRPGGH
jgi:hypothetical protein